MLLPPDAPVTSVTVEDIRFHFGHLGSGSDANNPQADYSNPYVTIRTDAGDGVGIGFTLGRGNEMVCAAVRELAPLVQGKRVAELIGDFATTWRTLANPLQSRWIAPGAGPYQMAAGAIANALFDLWARSAGLPLWRLLCALEPRQVVDMIDFRYVEHLLTRDEALSILERNHDGAEVRVGELVTHGLPCYHTTWIGSTPESLIEEITRVRDERGISSFKLKVGGDLEFDRTRLALVRSRFGDTLQLFTDANQVWSVPQAIDWMTRLSEYGVAWIEEPTAPDLIDGHRRIRDALCSRGIDIVTGENCPNSHVAGQLIAGGAVDRFQIDACRVIGPVENMLIMLIAAKYGVPICPHAGGSGLDELVPHLAAWNYACATPTQERVIVEQVGFCASYFTAPSVVQDGRVRMPTEPGYIVGMTDDARARYRVDDSRA